MSRRPNCDGVSIKFYLAIDCTLAEKPPNAHDVLRVFTLCQRSALCTYIMHEHLLIYRLMSKCIIVWETNKNLTLQIVNK